MYRYFEANKYICLSSNSLLLATSYVTLRIHLYIQRPAPFRTIGRRPNLSNLIIWLAIDDYHSRVLEAHFHQKLHLEAAKGFSGVYCWSYKHIYYIFLVFQRTATGSFKRGCKFNNIRSVSKSLVYQYTL